MNSSYEFLHLSSRERQIEVLENDFKKLSKPYVRKAYNYIIGKESSIEEKKGVESTIENIKELANHLAINPESKNIISNFSESFITSNESIKKILPIIKELRKELFSKEEPPFTDDPYRATEWLKNKVKEEAFPFKQDIEKNQKKISEIERNIEKKLRELFKLGHRYYSLKVEENQLLPIPLIIKGKFTGSLNYLFVWPHSPLARLEEETKRLSEETNFTQVSLVMFVLTGIRPISLKYNFISEIKFGRLGIKKRVNLIIYRPLNKEELKEIYYKIKKAFGRKGKQFLKDEHRYLYDLVDKNGGVPLIKKGEFWEKIRMKFNEKYPKRFNRPNSPRITYQRVKKYIEEKVMPDDFK